MSLVRVRIPSRWANGEGVADFKLGLGTCGKVVISLELDWARDCAIVTQVTEDREVKRFTYLHSQITGRIEETYA
jgi:hypothetical protein